MGELDRILADFGDVAGLRVLPDHASLDVSHLQPGPRAHTVCVEPDRPSARGPDPPSGVQNNRPATRPPAAPCPTCRCPRLWFDRYGGGPHCIDCKPPPSRAMVAGIRDVAMAPNGSFAWLDELEADERNVFNFDLEFDRRYRCYETPSGNWSVIERRDWNSLNSAMIVRGHEV